MSTRKRATKPKEPIPPFASREEEAAFWDSHDFADYWDEWQPVDVRFAANLSENVAVRLDAAAFERLRRVAHEKGISPAALVRIWILERIQAIE